MKIGDISQARAYDETLINHGTKLNYLRESLVLEVKKIYFDFVKILEQHNRRAQLFSGIDIHLKSGFNEKLNQSSMRFYKKVKYFNYSGMVVDKNEGKKLQKIASEDIKLIILKNHGVIILGSSIDELFHLNYHFEKCAEIQLKINDNKLNKVSNKICELTSLQHSGFGKVGALSWAATKKKFNLK